VQRKKKEGLTAEGAEGAERRREEGRFGIYVLVVA
jgi:hypothetical protein